MSDWNVFVRESSSSTGLRYCERSSLSHVRASTLSQCRPKQQVRNSALNLGVDLLRPPPQGALSDTSIRPSVCRSHLGQLGAQHLGQATAVRTADPSKHARRFAAIGGGISSRLAYHLADNFFKCASILVIFSLLSSGMICTQICQKLFPPYINCVIILPQNINIMGII